MRVAEEGLLRRSGIARTLPPVLADNGHIGANGQGHHLYLLTLTAPSEKDHSRFIPGRAGYRPGCRCRIASLAAWNAQASACWNRLRTALADTYDLAYFRAVEVQDGKRSLGLTDPRFALHHHVLLTTTEPVDAGRLHDLVTAAGYGCVMDLEHLVPGSRKAARYVSKYVTKACDQKGEVAWYRDIVNRETGEITEQTEAKFRTWSMSRNWGITMAEAVAASRAALASRAAAATSSGENPGPQLDGHQSTDLASAGP
jgi:hypothetical protein